MLKRFWRWLYGEPEPDTTMEMMRIIVQNQERTQTAMMAAVTQTIAAGEKQAEVLSQYLKLFSGSGEPTSWTEQTPAEEGSKDMKAMGFNPEGKWTEAEQAEWILGHLEQL
jgi:hypothetical protein